MTIKKSYPSCTAKECLEQLKKLLRTNSNSNFHEILNNIEPTVLSEALLLKNNRGWTLLHWIALWASDNHFLPTYTHFIQSLSTDTLTSLLQVQDMRGQTPLHWAVENENSTVAIALINKLSPEALSAAILVRDIYRNTPLLTAAKSNSFVLMAIIDRVSGDAVTAALRAEKKYSDPPSYIAGPHSENFIALISQTTNQTIRAIFDALKHKNLIPQNVLKVLLPRLDTVSALSLLNRDNLGKAIQWLLLDSAFDENLANIHQKLFTNKMAATLSDQIWLKIKSGKTLLPDIRLRMQLMTVLMAKPAYSLTQDEMSLFLYLKKTTVAKAEWIDTLIQQHLANCPLSSMIFSRDENLDAAYIKMLETKPEQIPDHCFDEVYELTLKIKKNEILIKIIAPNSHDDYLQQLNDYNHRPKIRVEKLNANYKFVHLTGEVVDYQYHNPKNKAAYTHTKKSSATLLGKNLKTPVFGHHHASRPLVGYLFNKEDCIIKAMLKQDIGTYRHQWLTQTDEEAKNAARLIGEDKFTDEIEFLNEVNKNSGRPNEVLVKVKKEALVAIVIARKDNNSISIAKERQKEVLDKLGLDLPIVFYDSNNGVLELVQEKWGNLTQSPKKQLTR
jgi:hypothetical protein